MVCPGAGGEIRCRDPRAAARYAPRVWGRSPGFALVVVLLLAPSIGANAAPFGLLDALVDRPPPGVPASDRLVWLMNSGPFEKVSYPDYVDLREQAAGIADIAVYLDTHLSLTSGGEPERVLGVLVSDNYFRVLGAIPVRGRAFLPEENRVPGAHAVAVIGHELWQRRFGGDPGIIGRTIVLTGHGFVVVGVAPPGFVGTAIEHPAEVWVPI